MKNTVRGVTLVELMIVVAIIAILAALGSMAYGRYIKSGKIQRLTAIAQDLSQGQERYRSRNNTYYPATAGQKDYVADKVEFENLLDFTMAIPPGVNIQVESWPATGNCTICQGVAGTGGAIGYAIVVSQDMNPDSTELTTVVLHNQLSTPIVLFEGE
ncbi:prepilin-type N-terminal cleavage/methylation domain-containing protein [Microvenator marinus]|uniref:Prepilin-type N-terminal cleavage/methylation domain-containing protein n=1 Tax=Microvenator marinus TaxID=2600177 RepID=A0A5B8XX20_9DELT|nr:prepilin-type N-terminal cleavage/methylation domain-containing protein [Microvenator marinus]QED29731.1 prepilin-type N-terminal cleavage/methylation domain-containing protein [Microvenator marinus]